MDFFYEYLKLKRENCKHQLDTLAQNNNDDDDDDYYY